MRKCIRVMIFLFILSLSFSNQSYSRFYAPHSSHEFSDVKILVWEKDTYIRYKKGKSLYDKKNIIPSKIGWIFGIDYTIECVPYKENIELTFPLNTPKIDIPKKGTKNKFSLTVGKKLKKNKNFGDRKLDNGASFGVKWSIENNYERVPGNYSISVSYNGKILDTFDFVVSTEKFKQEVGSIERIASLSLKRDKEVNYHISEGWKYAKWGTTKSSLMDENPDLFCRENVCKVDESFMGVEGQTSYRFNKKEQLYNVIFCPHSGKKKPRLMVRQLKSKYGEPDGTKIKWDFGSVFIGCSPPCVIGVSKEYSP